MDERQLTTLQAVIDCIIPADDFPSATGNGVDGFILRLIETELRDWRDALGTGLNLLEADARQAAAKSFAELPSQRQIELLRGIEKDVGRREWFDTLVRLTHEGYYADGRNGANRDLISWKMVGYDPRVPAWAMEQMK